MDPRSTMRDHNFRLLEIELIRDIIRGSGDVLDVGCGNGYSTVHYGLDVRRIVGVDYSKEFVEDAKVYLQQVADGGAYSKENVEFRIGNILDLDFRDGKFDVVVGERILVNLPTWKMQRKAVREVHRVLKKGGLYICSEATEQGHAGVNRYRRMFGLPDLERYWHNLYIDEPKFIDYASQFFGVEKTAAGMFGMYHFISKVIHPLLAAPEEPRFDAKINEVAREVARKIPDFGGCSHQVLFVMRKLH